MILRMLFQHSRLQVTDSPSSGGSTTCRTTELTRCGFDKKINIKYFFQHLSSGLPTDDRGGRGHDLPVPVLRNGGAGQGEELG